MHMLSGGTKRVQGSTLRSQRDKDGDCSSQASAEAPQTRTPDASFVAEGSAAGATADASFVAEGSVDGTLPAAPNAAPKAATKRKMTADQQAPRRKKTATPPTTPNRHEAPIQTQNPVRDSEPPAEYDAKLEASPADEPHTLHKQEELLAPIAEDRPKPIAVEDNSLLTEQPAGHDENESQSPSGLTEHFANVCEAERAAGLSSGEAVSAEEQAAVSTLQQLTGERVVAADTAAEAQGQRGEGAEDVCKDAAQDAGEEAQGETAEEVGKDVAQDAGEEAQGETAKEVGKDVAQDAGEEAQGETAEEVGKDNSQLSEKPTGQDEHESQSPSDSSGLTEHLANEAASGEAVSAGEQLAVSTLQQLAGERVVAADIDTAAEAQVQHREGAEDVGKDVAQDAGQEAQGETACSVPQDSSSPQAVTDMRSGSPLPGFCDGPRAYDSFAIDNRLCHLATLAFEHHVP